MTDIRDIIALESSFGLESTVADNEGLRAKNSFVVTTIICVLIVSVVTISYYINENRKLKNNKEWQ